MTSYQVNMQQEHDILQAYLTDHEKEMHRLRTLTCTNSSQMIRTIQAEAEQLDFISLQQGTSVPDCIKMIVSPQPLLLKMIILQSQLIKEV